MLSETRQRNKNKTHRNIPSLKHKPGNMSPTPLLSNLPLDPIHQPIRILIPFVHLQKQHDTLIRITGSPLPNTDAIRDLREMRFNDTVDIRRAKTHTTGVQHAVCAAEEEDLARDGMHLDEIAVCPYTRETGKVCRLVACACRVVAVEVNRLVGEGCCSDEFAWFAIWHRTPRSRFDEGVVDLDFHTQTRALAAATVHGLERVLDAEAPCDVGAARDVTEMDVSGETGVVEPFELRFGEDHAGCCYAFEGLEGGEGARGDVALLQLVEEFGRGAEVGYALFFEDGEEGFGCGLEGRAVVEDGAGAEEAYLD